VANMRPLKRSLPGSRRKSKPSESHSNFFIFPPHHERNYMPPIFSAQSPPAL
jgi:hypothetical protein